MSLYRSRLQLALTFFVGICLLALLLAAALILAAAPTARAPVMLGVLILFFVLSIGFGFLLLRKLFRPYDQLVGEAQRAPIAMPPDKARNEAEFVLQTFQTVVAQLQAQQRELEALSAQQSARAASAEKFGERIVASVPSGLIAFDSSGRATVVNAPARHLIEADVEAEGQHVRVLLQNAPDLAEMVLRCLETGELYRREEVIASGTGGRERRLGATVAPIELAPEQDTRGALCLLTDLTEVTQLREQVALKRNLESLGEMSAGLAHEFKNALATLHGYAQLLQNLNTDERGRAAAAALLQEVRNLSEMVTSFLNFARPQTLHPSQVSLRELLEDCALELKPFYQEHRVSLSISGEFPEILADERMLRQALVNIMRNAAEAFDEEQAERSVHVSAARTAAENGAHAWAVIEIRDTGGGIPASDLQRIFIPFFTTKSKGHGVGLALAHRVITEHGGTLDASNAQEGGAVFTLRLPA
ncbi:MAG TPA: ATP-binding protein [Pyrinomonadaceae bacterium]|jgi:nitrogen fixation/metabolism regulation signal transduction histidine kinase